MTYSPTNNQLYWKTSPVGERIKDNGACFLNKSI